MEIQLGHTPAQLLPMRALFLPLSQTLVIADLHLGKSATFRKRGLPIPEGTTQSDLGRLSQLLALTSPSQLVVAGDLVHAADGLSADLLATIADFFHSLSIPRILTEGNHDTRAWVSRRKLPFQIVPELLVDDLIITHDPADLPHDQAGIAGHLHPGVRIKDSSRSTLRTPGFFLRKGQHLILPAFSEFTGIQALALAPRDQFYAEVAQKIVEIPAALIRSSGRSH